MKRAIVFVSPAGALGLGMVAGSRLAGAAEQLPNSPSNSPRESAREGNDSPWSYLAASILGREIEEFGAVWHGCKWKAL